MSLHDELHRIAERAPIADVPDDTFTRGRRARRRDRVLVLAAVVGLLAGFGAVSLVQQHQSAPPVTGAGSLGVPEHLYAVPERMTARSNDGGWLRDEVSDDLAIGVGAAAWLSHGLPVVVDARTGSYHLLDLPGFSGNNELMVHGLASPAMTLSPDGRRLAYSWASFGPNAATEPIPSGVRVVDLGTGEVTSYPLNGEEGTAVTAISWSTDGVWIGWAGVRAGSWTTGSMGQVTPVAGRISVRGGSATTFGEPDRFALGEEEAIAVTTSGRVTFYGNGGVFTPVGYDLRRVGPPPAQVRAGTAPTDGTGRAALPTYDTYELMVGDGPHLRTFPLPARDDFPWETRPLAWAGDNLLVATYDLTGDPTARLLMFSTTTGRSRIVGAVDPGVSDSLSVAGDLVTARRPVVERPEPAWPRSDERWGATIALTALGALVVATLAFTLRRRTG